MLLLQRGEIVHNAVGKTRCENCVHKRNVMQDDMVAALLRDLRCKAAFLHKRLAAPKNCRRFSPLAEFCGESLTPSDFIGMYRAFVSFYA